LDLLVVSEIVLIPNGLFKDILEIVGDGTLKVITFLLEQDDGVIF
jgi:hypothetical protein